MGSLVQVRYDGEFGCFDEFRRRSLLCVMRTSLQTEREKELSNTILQNLHKRCVFCFDNGAMCILIRSIRETHSHPKLIPWRPISALKI